MSLISVIAPMFNEEEIVLSFLESFNKFSILNPTKKFELIMIDDGSTDMTFNIAKGFFSNAFKLNIIQHEKNLGLESAILSGLKSAKGNIICTMDGDMQDPFDYIISAVKLMEQNKKIDIIHFERKLRINDSIFKKLTAKFIYFCISLLTLNKIPNKDLANFKIFKRSFLERLLKININVYRVDVWYVNGQYDFIKYNRLERKAGYTKFSSFKMFKFAIETLRAVYIRELTR